jgi:nucleoid-associated protein YgaU
MGRTARIGLFLLMGLVVALARLIEVEVGKVRPQEETPSLTVTKPVRLSAPAHQKKTHRPVTLEHARHPTSLPAVVAVAAPLMPTEPKVVPTGTPLEGAEWPKGPVYVVKRGETLGVIAQKVLGTSKLQHRLFEANVSRITNPDFLKPGTKLVVPDRHVP